MDLLYWLSFGVVPIVGGLAFNRIAAKARGRNARGAFNAASWGCWLMLLGHLAHFGPVPVGIPIIGYLLNLILWLTPAAIAFLLAGSNMLKEMRAQKAGEFTDVA
ncbi:MAG TPA: hypothetical protein VKT77_18760 [Chthonomonadaceae bacterium]|nr:hypothetical protein [Chthonomonadaceae bacterium]